MKSFFLGKGILYNLVGPLLALFYCSLEWAYHRGFHGLPFWGWCTLSLLCLLPVAYKKVFSLESGQQSLGFLGMVVIAFLSLFFRPAYENDFYRYFFEGKALLGGINPYILAPSEVFDRVSFEAPFRVAFPELPAIYPPVTLALFSSLMALSKGSLSGALFLFSLVNGALIFMLFHWMDRRFPQREKVADFVLLAFLIRESCFQYHFELWAILPFLFALHSSSPFIKIFAYLFSFHLKFLGVLGAMDLLPKRRIKAFVIFSLFIGLSVVFFHKIGLFEAGGPNRGLKGFSERWMFAPGFLNLWWMFLSQVISFKLAKIISMLVAVVFSLVFLIKEKGRNSSLLVILCLWTFMYFSPVYNAWYALWPGLLLWSHGKRVGLVVLGLSPLCYLFFITQTKELLFVGNFILHAPYLWFCKETFLKGQERSS